MSRFAAKVAVLEMSGDATGELRRRALERLYLRRDVVDALIRSLEEYQDRAIRPAPCVPITGAARKCS
jgi:hypothetical protein